MLSVHVVDVGALTKQGQRIVATKYVALQPMLVFVTAVPLASICMLHTW